MRLLSGLKTGCLYSCIVKSTLLCYTYVFKTVHYCATLFLGKEFDVMKFEECKEAVK